VTGWVKLRGKRKWQCVEASGNHLLAPPLDQCRWGVFIHAYTQLAPCALTLIPPPLSPSPAHDD